MKNIISALIMLSVSFNSFSYSISLDGLSERNQDRIEKIKNSKINSRNIDKVKNVAKNAKKTLKIGKYLVSFKALNKIKKKGLIGGFVLIGGGAAATAATVRILSADYIAEELLKMTDDEINAYFAVNVYNYQKDEDNYLNKINKAINILLDKYPKIESQAEIENYERVFAIFDIASNDIGEFDGDSIAYGRSITEQEDLEKSKEFVDIMEMFKDEINKGKKRKKYECIPALKPATRMVETVPKIFKEQNIKYGVLTNKDTEEYAVNQYSYFDGKNENKKYEFDHIPSYKSLELKFSNNKIMKNFIAKRKKNKRFGFLSNNGTSVKIKKQLHGDSRTLGRPNQYFAKIDSLNIELATIKDISTLYYSTRLVNLAEPSKYNLEELKQALIIVYFRNLQLCLYE